MEADNVIPFEVFDTKRRLRSAERDLIMLRNQLLLDISDMRLIWSASQLLPAEDAMVQQFLKDLTDLEGAYTSIVMELAMLALQFSQLEAEST